MKRKEWELRLRERELFRGLRLVPGAWTVLRLDGRGFTRFTAERFEKPFDERLRDLMIVAARELLADFQGLYAVTHSDEISVVFAPHWELFDRRVEKLVSVSAAVVSAAFSLACGEAVHFDSRVWQGVSLDDATAYFRWRQGDAARCGLHSWCYWTLRRDGLDAEQAARALVGKGKDFQNEFLFHHGINFNDLPAWQRRGVGLCWESYAKAGVDPRSATPTTTERRRIRVELELPLGEPYAQFVHQLLQDHATSET
jgi:tRNA(His) 5'-end guanylyltransferase